jgi:hypothetical protein
MIWLAVPAIDHKAPLMRVMTPTFNQPITGETNPASRTRNLTIPLVVYYLPPLAAIQN